MWPFTKKKTIEKRESEGYFDSDGALLKALVSEDNVTEELAMNIPTFAACVSKISETISTLPIKLYERKGEDTTELKDDPRVRLLNSDTGDTLSGAEFKKAIVMDYLLHKGGYVFINRIGNNIKSLHYVEEAEVSFIHNVDPIFKEYRIMVRGKQYYPFQFLKVLRQTENGYYGKSIIDQCPKILATAYNELKYENTLVKTGGNKRGFLQSAKHLSESVITSLKEAFKRLYSDSAENVVVLNDGISFQEASSTAVENQMNENRKLNATEICKIFGIPESIITGGATQSDKINYAQFCIIPILEEFQNALNRDLLLEKEKDRLFFQADVGELVKGDMLTRYNAYSVAIKSGWIQPDEVRRKENMASLGMDWLRFDLSGIFYDPKKKEFFIPNTGEITDGHNPEEAEDAAKKADKLYGSDDDIAEEGEVRYAGQKNEDEGRAKRKQRHHRRIRQRSRS